MSFKEVTALRKAGETDKALAMARQDYSCSADRYSASALFWTLKVACERSLAQSDPAQASALLDEMKSIYSDVDDGEGIARRSLASLEGRMCPESGCVAEALQKAKSGDVDPAYAAICGVEFSRAPERVRENAGWVVFYYLRSHLGSIDEPGFDSAMEHYFSIGVPRPSMCHSQMLNLALKFTGNHAGYNLVAFLERWGIRSFSQEDLRHDSSVAGGLSLRDRAVRRCFLNRSVTLSAVVSLFNGAVAPGEVASILSGAYSSILYKDAVEKKDMDAFFRDADEYVSRIAGVEVRNQKHSHILDMAIWNTDDMRRGWLARFFNLWGGKKCLMDTDWVRPERDGKKTASLAERVLSRMSAGVDATIGSGFSDRYIELLEEAVRRFPDDENLQHRLASVRYASGDRNGAVELIRNVIRTHSGKFYFWSDLAEYLSPDRSDLRLACCCKALLAQRDEKFVGKIHLLLGSLLHAKGMEPEALAELERYRKTCEENGWIVKEPYHSLRSAIPSGTVAARDNHALYRSSEMAADEFVYSDLESHVMTLVRSAEVEMQGGRTKLMFFLYDSSNRSLRINPNAFGLDRKSRLMSCFSVKYVVEDGRKRPVSVRPCPKSDVLHFEQAVVVKVNPQKESCHVIGRGFEMGVPFRMAGSGISVGDFLEIAFSTETKEGKTLHRCLVARRCAPDSDLVKGFKGELSIRENDKGPLGHAGGLFIPGSMLWGLADGQMVSGTYVVLNGKSRVITVKPE